MRDRGARRSAGDIGATCVSGIAERHPAAIDVENGAGDVAGARRCEKQSGFGNVLGPPHIAHGDARADRGGVDLSTGQTSLIAAPSSHDPASRFNDGKVDRQGRFVCGTLVPHGHQDLGKLYRLDRDRAVICLETGIHISNSLSFAPDGRTMYFADSLRRAIWAYDYDPDTGAVGNKRVLIDTAPLKSGTDGACIDGDGCLWVALVEIGQIARITPGGRIDRSIAVPAEFPSCPAFGGPGLSTLFVTSIRDTGTGRMKGTRPESGKVMAITNLGVSGVPEPRFADA